MSLFSGALDYGFGGSSKARIHLREPVEGKIASIEGIIDGADNLGVAVRDAQAPDGKGYVFVPWGAIQYIIEA